MKATEQFKTQINELHLYQRSNPSAGAFNHGKSWKAYDLRELKLLSQQGKPLQYIASCLGRTELACQIKINILRTAMLLEADDDLTLKEIKL